MDDLLLLVADKNMQALATALLQKFARVEGCMPIVHRCVVHSEHDSGVLHQGPAFVRQLQYNYRYCLLLLDHEGCGREAAPRTDLEAKLEATLANVGWAERSAAIVIAPELEQWIWLGEIHIEAAIDWRHADGHLYQWLEERNWKDPTNPKPTRPKEALEEALRHVGLSRSSAIIADIVKRGSYQRCNDPAFLKLLDHLRLWFGNRLI